MSKAQVLHRKLASYGLDWMSEIRPKFYVPADNISVLSQPSEFFNQLKELITQSSKRITIASLYLGTTEMEKELVDCFRKSLLETESKDVNLYVLLDSARGSRGNPNSRTMLLPLIQEFPNRVRVSLYHTPALRGWLRKLLPEKWNEIVGLCHLKVYLFDDTLIMSGANLNDQYFQQRQDRYVVFKNCPELANFFDDLVKIVGSFSLQVNESNDLSLDPSWSVHPYLDNPETFSKRANKRLNNLLTKYSQMTDKTNSEESLKELDTFVFPLIQMNPFGINHDQEITNLFFQRASKSSTVKLTSGYLNLTQQYTDAVLKNCQANVDVLAASPEANGFLGARGLAGLIPSVYTYMEKQFCIQVNKLGQSNRIRLYEYQREKWTFHAKGIWYYPPNQSHPAITFIGSPNFGYRSVYKDLEAQIMIATVNPKLRQNLHNEQENLYDSSYKVSEQTFEQSNRKVSLFVRILSSFIKTFF